MAREPYLIEGSNLSEVWGRTLLKAMTPGQKETAPQVVVINDFDSPLPSENAVIRQQLDKTLDDLSKPGIETTANTIFPESMWRRSEDRQDLYSRYERIIPRLHRVGANRNGTYFERLIRWGEGTDEEAVNQLEKLFDAKASGVTRRTAFQATAFDPRKDLTNQPRRGFPCLDHVSLTPDSSGGLEVNAFYTMQFIVERSYGNYLGLARLGRFVAEELDLRLTKVGCVAAIAQLGTTKTAVRDLADAIENELV